MAGSCAIEVGGSPSAIRAAAEWLRHQVESAASEADVIDGLIATTSTSYWQGRAGAAFSDTAGDLVSASREISEYAGPFAEILHVFAGRVERMQEHFEGFLASAADAGIVVTGTTMHEPSWAGPVPQNDHDESWGEWRTHQRRLRTYDRIQNDVVLWHADHKAWILANLVEYAGTMPEKSQAQELNEGIRETVGIGFSATNKYLDVSWEQKVAYLTSQAEGFAYAAAEMSRRSYAAGDPALRAKLLEAIENGTPEHLRGVSKNLDSIAEMTKTLRHVLDTVGGPAVDVGLGVWAIADGEEPVDVVVQWVGGLGGAGIAGAVLAGATLPIWGSAAIVIGAASAGSAAVGAIWESTPASWRQGIYEFSEDGFIIVGDVGEQIGDWFVETSIDIGQWFN
ncbi:MULTISPECIES: hypothetical protein [unclassified Microbacterium]|uniref:hypothetical protein n=1 Tax=unclassified Microbacterium TaxID=2609290 RepID=UPI003467A107